MGPLRRVAVGAGAHERPGRPRGAVQFVASQYWGLRVVDGIVDPQRDRDLASARAVLAPAYLKRQTLAQVLLVVIVPVRLGPRRCAFGLQADRRGPADQ